MKQKLKKLSLIILTVLVLIGVNGCAKGGTLEAQKAYKSEKLVWWRVWDNEDAVSDLIKAYKQIHPNVTIEYKKFRYEEYEKELLEALAEDRGPDIFSIHNTWMERYKTKLMPLPATTIIPVKYITGTVKKEEIVELVTKNSLTPGAVRKNFIDVVATDVVMKDDINAKTPAEAVEKVWGLPISMDTLVMYYNKDLLNNSGVIEPAKSWADFQEQVKKITKIDKDSGQILISGTSLGTAGNVDRNFDILSLLMMQNLTPMIVDGQAMFSAKPKGMAQEAIAPGIGALEYYVQFSSPLYEGYSWNDKMPNSLEAFMKGQVGYFFGYTYHRDEIKAKAPKLNLGIAPVPQVGEGQRVNYANYWVEGVSNKTKIKNYAWDFAQFVSDEKNVVKYLEKNKKPTALKSTKLINAQLLDEELAAPVEQLLTAKSWYHGESPNAAETIFAEMINSVVNSSLQPQQAINQAVEKINFSLNKKL
ncbi:MAG: extracellular solute-binding protein [Patescibacteria group bacterium]